MRIKVAKNAGTCFGVERAIQTTSEVLTKENSVYCHGELVHNPSVNEKLQEDGLQYIEKYENLSPGTVIIRSHGIPKSEKHDIIYCGHNMIDLTCPVLLNIYKLIQQKQQVGYEIVIVGDRRHPEIIAMSGQLDRRAIIVESEEEALSFTADRPLYVVSQTTNRMEFFNHIASLIQQSHDNVEIHNTICNATRQRQESCELLAKEVDAMIVIGGKNSSNTKKLYDIASLHCKKTIWIETYKEIDYNNLIGCDYIGITAGASTPRWIIEEVVKLMDNYSKDEFMEQVEGSITKVYPKDIVKGTIIYVTDSEVMVNINYKADGIIKQDELSQDQNARPKDLFKEGEEIDVYVIKLDDGEGNVVLSTRRVEGLKNWQKLMDIYNNDETVVAKIQKEVKGGLLANTLGITAFLPGSQITTYFVKDLSKYIGQELECKIISVDEKKRRLVISRKVIEEAEEQVRLDEAWSKFEENDVIKGTVARLTDFGAFINLGGVDGLIHISDIAWSRIKHPSEVLKVGDEIDVLVLRKNREKNRISLGYKQLSKKPFESFLENNKEGDIVKGTVVNLVDFGAFIRLDEGVEGLVHVSQISNEHVEKPSDELNLNDEVEVKILEINPETKKIALSIKATKEPIKTERSVSDKPAYRPEKAKKRNLDKTSEIEGFKNQELDNSIGSMFDFDLEDN